MCVLWCRRSSSSEERAGVWLLSSDYRGIESMKITDNVEDDYYVSVYWRYGGPFFIYERIYTILKYAPTIYWRKRQLSYIKLYRNWEMTNRDDGKFWWKIPLFFDVLILLRIIPSIHSSRDSSLNGVFTVCDDEYGCPNIFICNSWTKTLKIRQACDLAN